MNDNSLLIPNEKKLSAKFRMSGRTWGLLILILAYSFLAYKLITFDQYNELLSQWQKLPITQFWWLGFVFLLLPINWLLESIKWRLLVSKIQTITIAETIKSVLTGISTGFITPNRVGEFAGRILFLKPENRKAGVTLSLVNSLTQNIIMALCGVPAAILFFSIKIGKFESNLFLYLIFLIPGIIILGLAYFYIPTFSKRFKFSRFALKVHEFTDCLSDFSKTELFRILLISLVRYAVFCVQFFLMLRFFGIDLTFPEAVLAIPTTYLFVTFTPSLAISEAAVRSSYAVLFISAFSGQVASIALAGVSIWFVNFVIPMLIGSVLILRSKTQSAG